MLSKPSRENYSTIFNDYNFGNRKVHMITLTTIFFVVTLVIFATLLALDDNDASEDASVSSESISLIKLNFTLYKENYKVLPYFNSSNPHKWKRYAALDGFAAIVEPYSYMKISVEGEYSSDVLVTLNICKEDTSECQEAIYKNAISGVVKFACEPYDKFVMTWRVYDSNDEVISTVSSQALCLYVRREFRALTTSDRNRVMDAMYMLWNTSDVEGQALYGDKFHNITYYTKVHLFNAGWPDGDHIHEGNGFLPQHLKITNEFEVAIQAVDPSVSLPYWDYTIESQMSSLYESPYFTPDTFGTLTKPNGTYWTYKNNSIIDARIPDGRWKDTRVEKNIWYQDIVHGYGLSRSSWNFSPSPYIMRFYDTVTNVIPTCRNFNLIIQKTQFYYYSYFISLSSHGGTHASIAGKFGCDIIFEDLQSALDMGDGQVLGFCKLFPVYLKDFYRLNYYRVDTPCDLQSLDGMGFHCNIICNDNLTDAFRASLVDSLYNSGIWSGVTDSDADYIIDWFCNGRGQYNTLGDHMESASTHDPTFWSIHPTLERVTAAKMMADDFIDYSWPTNATAEYVCDWAPCYNFETMELGYWDTCCLGHYENDRLLNCISGNRSDGGRGFTNKEILDKIHPLNETYDVNYVFDDFVWDHCKDQGIDIEGYFTSKFEMQD